MSTITTYTGLLRYQLLEQYDLETGLATGIYKPNHEDDPDYVAPIESNQCPVRVTRWIGKEETAYCEQDVSMLSWDTIDISFDSEIVTFDNQSEL